MKKILGVIVSVLLGACATPRSNSIFSLQFADQPPRAVIRAECNGQSFTTQGAVVCEQRTPSAAKVAVKVPPLEGRVIYSNGQLKRTDDFNWYPKQGFFIWKKKQLKDTYLDLDLGEVASTFGDWPVAIDIAATDPEVGVIVTRGILYHRICNDQDIPCSQLVTEYECAGYRKFTMAGEIGKCERLSGSPQAVTVHLSTEGYQVQPGAKLYVQAQRLGMVEALDITAQDLAQGFKKIELPQVQTGPTLVGLRVAWWEKDKLKQVETRILIIGFSPEWTGLDKPHYLIHKEKVEWLKPVMSDLLEVNTYQSGQIIWKEVSRKKPIETQRLKAGQYTCAFAWQRDSSDLTHQCLDRHGNEVKLP